MIASLQSLCHNRLKSLNSFSVGFLAVSGKGYKPTFAEFPGGFEARIALSNELSNGNSARRAQEACKAAGEIWATPSPGRLFPE
jgi:hypothetical protein